MVSSALYGQSSQVESWELDLGMCLEPPADLQVRWRLEFDLPSYPVESDKGFSEVTSGHHHDDEIYRSHGAVNFMSLCGKQAPQVF